MNDPSDTTSASPSESTQTEPAENAAVSSESTTSESVEANPAEASQVSSEDAAAEDGADAAPEAEGESAEAAGEAATGDGKKKRRRRKKKKASAEGGAEQAPKVRKDPAQWPFGRWFEGGHGSRRHIFSVGEIVAGRVAEIDGGVLFLDLFGKAKAVVDANEPRDIAELPKPEPESAPSQEATENTGTTAEATEASTEPLTSAESSPEAAEEAAHAQATEAEDEATSGGEIGAPEPEVVLPLPERDTIFRGRIGHIAESGHIVLVNRVIDIQASRKELEARREQRQRVRGLVYGFNRGGFDVLALGVRVFCPASGMSLGPIEDPETYVGQLLEFSVPPSKPGTHGLVVGRRSILERELRKRGRERLKALRNGDRVQGRVIQVREFELFIDLGEGLEGIVQARDLSFDRSVKTSDVAKAGDELTLEVIRIPDLRARYERVSLSLKATQPDPWDAHDAVLGEGTHQKGKVTRVAEFGAFVELAPGIEGLLHISELGRDLKHASEAIKEGEVVDVVVERVDKRQHRVSLSKLSPQALKAMGDAAAAGAPVQSVRPGSHVKARVERIEHHGLLVQIDGVLGKRGRGYIPNSEMGTERGTDHRKLFPVGALLDVKILGADRDGGLKMSRKGFVFDEEKRAVSDYRREASKQGFGTFGDLLRAKIGATK